MGRLSGNILPRAGARNGAVRVAAALALAGGVTACESGGLEDPQDQEIEERRAAPLYFGSGGVWTNGQVPVCFMNLTGDAKRLAVRRAVEGTWEPAAHVNFTGWQGCARPVPDFTVPIKVDTNLPAAGFATIGMIANPEVRFRSDTPATRTILHEFGHTLGFTDANVSATDCSAARAGTSLEWENDVANSIMTNSVCTSAPASLSAWDVMGTRRIYGPHAQGSIVGLGGLCLRTSSDQSGATILGAPCSVGAGGNPGTRFRRVTPFSTLLNSQGTSLSDHCLDTITVPSTTGFTQMVVNTCNTGVAPTQSFAFDSVEWRAMGNMCVAADSAAAGSQLGIAVCNGSSRQRWNFFRKLGHDLSLTPKDGRIQLAGTNLCVNVPRDDRTPGTRLILWDCGDPTAFPNEVFTFENSFIKYKSVNGSPRCLNVSGGVTTPGRDIILWDDCANQSPPHFNEQFTLRGRITTSNGFLCVNLRGGVPFEGVQIGTYPCQSSATPNELWEYFW